MGEEPEKKGGSHRTEIIVALIGLAGVLGGAIFANWDKLFPPEPKVQPPPGRASTATPGTTPVSPVPVAPSGLRVIEVRLRADPSDYTGRCPVRIRFSGRISVVGGSGTVSYRFLRSDGASAPVQTLRFDGAGSKDIAGTWELGAATPRFQPFSGWQSIKILEPTETESNRAQFRIHCR
jgi:hypothetical protein